jgi:hypothetical protein
MDEYPNYSNEELALNVRPGWRPIILDLLRQLAEVPGWRNDMVRQIKEKFGGLRFYWWADADELPGGDAGYQMLDERVEALIKQAEERAWKTCEICGGTEGGVCQRGKGWIVTQCDACNEKYEADRQAERERYAKEDAKRQAEGKK